MPLFSVLLGFGVKAAAALSAAVVTGAPRWRGKLTVQMCLVERVSLERRNFQPGRQDG